MRKIFHKSTTLEPWQDPAIKPYIVIENLTKEYDGVPVLKNVNLEIYKEEFFCLLGPSGCGKSTLLRLLGGFETPTSGRIYIDGVDITDVPPYERPVNMMFQSYALFPHMTVQQNIAFGLQQEKMPKDEIAVRVDEALALVQMTQYRRRKPAHLSGGQRQRVALARCLVKRPRLLLLDEPLAALDRKLRESTQFELVNIQESVGVTFMMVTHDQEEAMTIATRLAVMEEGGLSQVGTPHEVYEFPNTRYVADFIGGVNIFEGLVVEEADEQMQVQNAALEMPLLITPASGAPIGSTVSVAIRPEKIHLSKRVNKRAHNSASGTVQDIAYLGDVSIYHVVLEDQKTIISAMMPNELRLAEGKITWDDKVYLSWDASSAVVLTG